MIVSRGLEVLKLFNSSFFYFFEVFLLRFLKFGLKSVSSSNYFLEEVEKL